jgi:hypothetical protein
MSVLKILILCLICLSFVIFGYAQSQERIIEKIEVTNVEVPVRVFFKGKAVSGLKKSDFTLLVNGKKRDIHGFYEFKKKIAAPEIASLQKKDAHSRLFLLIFNICHYNPDAVRILDIFFDKIFCKNDRLMVITNRLFFDDRKISNPLKEREKLKKVLLLEMENVREKSNYFKRRMESMLRLFKARLKYTYLRDLTSNEFVRNYCRLVWEFKNLYLTMKDSRYLQLAQYLKAQKAEKWVLSFYQIGHFFKPKWNSEFRKLLLGDDFMRATKRYHELQEALKVEEPILDDDLSKVFADTGASFHTILMEDRESMRNDLSADLSYKPIVSASYLLLEKIAKKTGGTFMHSDDIDQFYQEITADHDIFYMLTYVPKKREKQKKSRIKVIVKNKKYRPYYDDGKRGSHFRKMIKKKTLETPQIRIDQVSVNGNFITIVVSHFKIDEKEPITELLVRLQVFTQQSENIYDGVETFTIKDLSNNKVRLQVELPKLPAGLYDLFIWVGDPLTGKHDVAVKELNKEL